MYFAIVVVGMAVSMLIFGFFFLRADRKEAQKTVVA
jgi:uncharacterized membrane protein YciS (DUF1049 family)